MSGGKSYRVRIWAVVQNKTAKKPTYQLRWKVDGKPFSLTFTTKGLADRFRGRLMRATEDGEPFDLMTGLPDSMAEAKAADSFLSFALAYMDMKWPHAAAKSRASMTETLMTALPAFVRDVGGQPDTVLLRSALRRYLLPPPRRGADRPADVAKAIAWLEKASMPVADLKEAKHIHDVLDALGRKLDGTAAGAETTRRKRSVLYNVLDYAVELEHLATNPIDKVKRKRIKVSEVVDRRAVANPKQARELLTAVSYVGGYKRASGRKLVAFFAVMYYAGTRPAEAVGLRRQDCELPENGWGMITLHRTRPTVGKLWTDTGTSHDDRGLKQRSERETRPVPIPPVLVRILQDHIDTFGTHKDGRLFPSERGGVLASSSYYRIWQAARALALTPEQVASPLAARPYDLRHACASLWLNSGVPAPEVAERLGHSVDVLLKIYAKCIDGQRETVNKRIAEALGADAGDVGESKDSE
ncbi:tyrosine-type recombinase/integrase [Yinghuangia sp. YIM S10712]|uniref:tyrosine-type recombinase/integrase n=1 Tax=Yinghuangia sp. YIM S10712 TaxID=3436930 RepID=UPI003F533703